MSTIRCPDCGEVFSILTTHQQDKCLRRQVEFWKTKAAEWKEAWHTQRAATGAVAWEWTRPWHPAHPFFGKKAPL